MTMEFVKENIMRLTPAFTKQSSDEVRKILKEFKLELAYPKEQTASERGLYDVYVLDRFLFAISTQSPLYEN